MITTKRNIHNIVLAVVDIVLVVLLNCNCHNHFVEGFTTIVITNNNNRYGLVKTIHAVTASAAETAAASAVRIRKTTNKNHAAGGRIIRRTSFDSITNTLRSYRLYSLNNDVNYSEEVEDDDEDDDDDDDDDDDYPMLQETALGDWRKFRANLINDGLPGNDNDDDDDVQSENQLFAQKNESSSSSSLSSTTKVVVQKQKQIQQVAVENEQLLETQNKQLATEYRSGVWAHTIVQPEVGGLLCRLPLQAELYYGTKSTLQDNTSKNDKTETTTSNSNYWKDKLNIILSLESSSTVDNPIVSSSSTTTKTTTSSTNIVQNDKKENDEVMIYNKVDRWFQAATKMTTKELTTIATNNNMMLANGALDSAMLSSNERLLLEKIVHYEKTWQEVSLVLSHNEEDSISETVVLNRPITKSINPYLAKIMLEGLDDSNSRSSSSTKSIYTTEIIESFASVFKNEAAVYMGGPHNTTQPAIIIHGISNLEGSYEIAPGTNIYRNGNVQTIINGIQSGLYQPLDFRFFIGQYYYNPLLFPQHGTILQKIYTSSYQPIACARTLALKQCLGLPKPLWHEVLELCGGEMKAISEIEFLKRSDLKQ